MRVHIMRKNTFVLVCADYENLYTAILNVYENSCLYNNDDAIELLLIDYRIQFMGQHQIKGNDWTLFNNEDSTKVHDFVFSHLSSSTSSLLIHIKLALTINFRKKYDEQF